MSVRPALRSFPVTDVGRVRDGNEDSFLVDEKMSMYVVCDGMGGHAAGEVASNVAVHTFRNTLLAQREMIDNFEKGVGTVGREDILRLMEKGVQQACSAIYNEAQKDPTKRGMGTTLVAMLIIGSRGFIAHVGDSRVYLMRNQGVEQLTVDHSLINELLKRGRHTPEQIAKLNMKNAMTRAVGVYESVEADTTDLDVLPGDRFLLCSDGLTEYVELADIARIFTENPEDKVSQKFIDHANASGGKDNITAVSVFIPDEGGGLDRLAKEVNLKLETLHGMPLFRHLTYLELVRVMNLIDVRSFGPKQEIVAEGQEGDEMFIVLVGEVNVHTGDNVIVKLGAGQHFGEMALLDKAPRSASVSSVGDSKLMAMKRRDFFDIVRKDHDVAVKLLWSFLGELTERLRKTSRELGEAREQLSLKAMSDAGLSDADLEEL